VEIQPKVHIFGHVHESAGLLKQDDIQFINASSVDKDKEFTNPLICFNYSVESGFELLNV
jgi:Icc-related predicted phosphoesterase